MCPSGRDPTTSALAGPSPDVLRPAFDLLDSDRDGRISLADLKQFYSDLAASISDEEIAAMIATADADRNGFVDYGEFERVLTTRRKRENRNTAVREMFDALDRDGDGRVGFEDLRAHLRTVGLEVADEEVKAMIEMAGGGTDADGGVSFDGLVRLLQNGF